MVGGCLVPDPPPTTTTPKLQLDFLDLENFLVKVWGGGGGGYLAPDPPTTTTPKLQLDFLDLEFFLVKVWGGGGGGVSGARPPPPPPPLNSTQLFWTYKSDFLCLKYVTTYCCYPWVTTRFFEWYFCGYKRSQQWVSITIFPSNVALQKWILWATWGNTETSMSQMDFAFWLLSSFEQTCWPFTSKKQQT